MQRTILHIDFDSFFASVEQQDNSLYRTRPIGVTATNGRTCIIAASREAKVLGIKSPSRTFEAQRICPSINFVPAHFNRYWEISKKFIDICKDFTPYVEIFSLDEVFMDVTRTANLFGGTMPLIEKIKTRLKNEVGEYITASFGVSHNKLLSKLASGMEKPNGLVVIEPQDVMQIYKRAKLTDICGIGGRIEARLNEMGICALNQLSAAPLRALIAEFGDVEGHFLYQVGQGQDDREIIPYTDSPDVKSVGRNYCLPDNEYDKRKVLQNIFELCEEVGIKLRRLDKKARAVGIYLRGGVDFHARKTYSQYMDSGRDLFRALGYLLNSENSEYSGSQRLRNSDSQIVRLPDMPSIPNYVRQISVWAFHLEDSDNIPASLFDPENKIKLGKTIDAINEKYGDHTIRNGFLLDTPKLTTVPNGFMSDRYERTKYAKEQADIL